MDETDDQRCMRIAEGVDRAKQEGKGGQIIEDMIWLFDRAAGRAAAIKDAVAAENKMCVEILIERAKNASGEIRDFAEEVAQAIEKRPSKGE